MQGFRRVRKHLMCAHCETLIAAASYRPWLSWRLDIRSYEGYQITPLAGSLQLRLKTLVREWVLTPTTMPWGNRSMLFRDPDGNLVNLFAPVTDEAINRFSSH